MAKKDKEIKTNAMRILDKNKAAYEVVAYECGEFVDGVHIADLLGQPYEISFKTLVAVGKSGNHYVFVLPVDKEVDFKKAAKCAGEKSVELIAVKDINGVTGYIRGGCTPVGMKKQFPTFVQQNAQHFDKIIISGGQLGLQIHLNPQDLLRVTGGVYADFEAEGCGV